jgi:tryptophan 2,3-dioxygenase
MSYGDYLHLDGLLDNVHPLSDAHDEFLFMVQHQTSELWMKQAIREITTARDFIGTNNLRPAFKLMARLETVLKSNSLYDEALLLLTRSGFSISP